MLVAQVHGVILAGGDALRPGQSRHVEHDVTTEILKQEKVVTSLYLLYYYNYLGGIGHTV